MTRRFGELDLHLAGEGRHERLYDVARRARRRDDGVAFAVWAPNARAVAVVGDFNGWDGRATRCEHARRRPASGRPSSPASREGARYKFEIAHARTARVRLKADPFAFAAEVPPAHRVASSTRPRTSGATTSGWSGARAPEPLRRADVDLRGAPRLVAAQPARGQPLARLPRARAASSPTTRPTSASRTSSCCR